MASVKVSKLGPPYCIFGLKYNFRMSVDKKFGICFITVPSSCFMVNLLIATRLLTLVKTSKISSVWPVSFNSSQRALMNQDPVFSFRQALSPETGTKII